MANEKNLKPSEYKLTQEEAKKGGKKSASVRREKKLMRDTLQELLTMPVEDGKLDSLDKIKSIASAKGKNISVQEAIMLAQIQKAVLKGDTRAAEFVRDTAGQKPVNNLDIDVTGVLADPFDNLTVEELRALLND